jgi:hypothetical protein
MLTGLLALVAALTMALSIPLAAEKVPPNWLYGFRTPRTVKDDRVWYPVNRVAGRNGIVLSLVLALATVMSFLGVSAAAVMGLLAAVVVMGTISTFVSAGRIVNEIDEAGPRIDYRSSIGRKEQDPQKAREKLLKKLRKE